MRPRMRSYHFRRKKKQSYFIYIALVLFYKLYDWMIFAIMLKVYTPLLLKDPRWSSDFDPKLQVKNMWLLSFTRDKSVIGCFSKIVRYISINVHEAFKFKFFNPYSCVIFLLYELLKRIMIEYQLPRRIMKYSKCLPFPPSLQCNSNNQPFLFKDLCQLW